MNGAAAEAREQVGPYRLLKAIGAGGSARIDLARIDRAYGFQRHVVIKRPLEHLRGSGAVAASLRREARIGGRLRHPNLVAVLDAGVHDGYDYLALEYVHGASLRTLMETEVGGTVRELPLGAALAIAVDVARGVHEAHELCGDDGAPLGLVHRDVSPGNVLLGLDGTVKLADFGIAKETRASTLSGSMHGTVTYMAPEQCRGHAFDRRADIFSLGVILYELVTGRRLFWADNDVASLHRVLSGQIPRPRSVRSTIAAPLEEIVMKALASEPDRRFATARQLADALEAYAAGAGEVIGARWIARVLEEVVGPKQVPWIAATTVPDARGAAGEGSLVDVIAAAPAEEDEELAVAEGEVAEGLEEPSVTRVAPMGVARRRSRAALAAIIAVGVVGGSAVTAMVMMRESGTVQPGKTTAPLSTTAAPAAAPTLDLPTPDLPTPDHQEIASPPAPAPVTTPAPAPAPARHRHHRPAAAASAPAVAAAPPADAPPPPPAAAKGSAANVEWNPTILLPSDTRRK